MGKLRINIDTGAKIQKFVDIINANNVNAVLESTGENGENYRVNARSLLGALATMDWNDVWVKSDEDIYSLIEEFVVV
jgi:hypothetical protein